MTAEEWERTLGHQIWEAATVGDVEVVLKTAEERYGIKKVPVGRDNNIGTIRMASDPGLALVERVTNGIDGLIELAVLLQPGADPRTPEEAARLLFGVPAGGLGDMLESQRRALAEQLVVTFLDSGAPKHPSVRIDDKGTGQHPVNFGRTLLSLNENNKNRTPYTMGTYGQGGSVTFGFSQYTILVSRVHAAARGALDDLAGWTVVFEEEGDPNTDMLPWYVWVVRPDGSPFTLPPECLPELEHGTRITHVNYDVQSLSGPFTTQAWQFFHAALFDPVLPFLIAGTRNPDERKAKDRVIIGNAARLANPDKARGDIAVAVQDTHRLDLGPRYGTTDVSYWALTRPSGKASAGAAEAYVQANNAVSLTLHGQRQDAERRTWIKDRANLPYLYKNMVVHIDGNGLTPVGRRELFASTRERATESELRKTIYERTAELLRTDPELKRLNHDEKEKLLRKSTAAANEKVRKRLGKFVKTKLHGTAVPGSKPARANSRANAGGSGAAPGSKAGQPVGHGGPSDERDTDDRYLPHVPTAVAFESKKVRVAQGRRGYVWVAIDAKNGYLPEHDDALDIFFSGETDARPMVHSRSKLLGGRSRWAIGAGEEVDLGTYELSVELLTANGMLTASIPVEVVAPPHQAAEGPGGQEEDTGPEVRWVFKSNWNEQEMNATTVGRVDQDDESTIIWVNRDFGLLAKALSSSTLTPDQVTTRADRYQYPVACGLWLQQHELKNADPRPDDAYLRAELHRLAEAVLVAMDPDVELAGLESED